MDIVGFPGARGRGVEWRAGQSRAGEPPHAHPKPEGHIVIYPLTRRLVSPSRRDQNPAGRGLGFDNALAL